jgi:hypothetical protein
VWAGVADQVKDPDTRVAGHVAHLRNRRAVRRSRRAGSARKYVRTDG